MPTSLSAIETLVRATPLIEPVAKYWTSTELQALINQGIKDLWRSIVDLKQEHYLTIDDTNVILPANSSVLVGVPNDVHKVYMVEPRDLTQNGSNRGLMFQPRDYNSDVFQMARSTGAIDPVNGVIYYAVHKQGAPVNAPEIRVAPQVTSTVPISFCYVPSLVTLPPEGIVPIPGEADNALVAWTVAYARAKERDDRSPDPAWLAIYANEKQNILQSLGLRDYQENTFAEAVFENYWG
jgi:hypothetical protein